MDVSAATWNTLSKLLDEALDLEPAERASWLDGLGTTQPEVAPILRKLLAAHASSETSDLLQQLPALDTRAVSAETVAGLGVGARVGPYRLKRELGSGGMADVWLAERADGAFERDVALKLPRLSRLRRDLAERFTRERDILARLEHPHIARFYDAGVTDDSLPYLAIEYVNGQPITQWCDERRLDVAARLELFAQVLDAVQFAHASLVIHRDLKPSNILVTADGQVRLLDFGIAKLLSDADTARETRLTQVAGRVLTPDYASPEQIKGENLTTATDIYSLGVVLYELIAGRLPYQLKLQSAAQLEQAIVAADPARPSSGVSGESSIVRGTSQKRLARALRGDLDTIVLKALAKEPAQRYATVAEVADDLRRHLAGQTVHARPASWGYRTRKFISRNRVAVTAAVAVTVALIAATAVSLSQAQRARAQADLARQNAVHAEEVKNFILSIFADADTARGGSRSTTALDLLRQARERLEAAPVTDPSITAELLNSVGYSLIGLGEYVEAIPVLEHAVQMSSKHLGTDHATSISANLNLGEAYLAASDDIENARRVISTALASARRSGDVKQLVNALRWMGAVHSLEARHDEGLRYAQESVRLADANLAHDKHTVMLAHWQEANILYRMRADGALEATRRTYELAREYWGDRPTPDVLAARSFYAVVLAAEGDAQTALAELRAVRQEQMRLFGGNSYVDVIHTNVRIGHASLALGDPVTALASYREALQGEEAQTGGGNASQTAINRMRVGQSLLAARRFDEAEGELRRAYAVLKELRPARATEAASLLAAVLTHEDRLQEAEAIFASVAEPPTNPRELAMFKSSLGQLRSAQGRHAEVLPLLREAYDLSVKAGTPSDAAVALATLGSAQLAAGSSAEALATLQRADLLLDKLHPYGSPDHADLRTDIARAQLELGRPQDAVTAARRADEFWTRFDAGNRHAGLAAVWHARALRAAGQGQQGLETWKRASAILIKNALPADRTLLAQTSREFRLDAAAD
ncbi:MAG TPA: protein kinase [Steroidobacteraceae bacterium]|nr:protein kinase [Steroidobacteraceae bacterium]